MEKLPSPYDVFSLPQSLVACAPQTNDTRYIALTAIGTCALAILTLVLVGVTYWFMRKQVKVAERTAQVELFFKIRNDYETGKVLTARHHFSSPPPLPVGRIPGPAPDAETLLDFFETLGDLTKREFLDHRMVWNEFSIAVRCYWPALEPHAQRIRNRYGDDPTVYVDAEWLNKHMHELEKKWGYKGSSELCEDAYLSFFHSESL